MIIYHFIYISLIYKDFSYQGQSNVDHGAHSRLSWPERYPPGMSGFWAVFLGNNLVRLFMLCCKLQSLASNPRDLFLPSCFTATGLETQWNLQAWFALIGPGHPQIFRWFRWWASLRENSPAEDAAAPSTLQLRSRRLGR